MPVALGRTGVVLQARMGSARLPGKVLARFGGGSMLAHTIQRLRRAEVGPVIVATTALAEDDAVAEEAGRHGALVVRGSAEDVLARFTAVIRRCGLQFVIRATADNPAVDADAAVRTLRLLRTNDLDYVLERDLPYGAAVEAVRADALCQADAEAIAPYDREHVTTFLRGPDRRFRTAYPDAPMEVRRPELRLTVDTAEDLAYMRRLRTVVGAAAASVPLVDWIRAADRLATASDARIA